MYRKRLVCEKTSIPVLSPSALLRIDFVEGETIEVQKGIRNE
jgi:hypothetical protein